MTRLTHSVATLGALVLSASLLVAAPSTASPSTSARSSAAPTAAAPAEPSAKRGSRVAWDVTVVNPGTKIRAHGKVPGGKRKVLLQVKVKNTWKKIGSTKSTKRGKFRIAGRLDWYGRHTVRVLAPGRRGFAKSKRVAVYPPYVPIGNPKNYNFIRGKTVNQNYRFNPCGTVNYRVNAEDVGASGVALVQLAMLQASWATGIKFKYKGSSKAIPYNMGPRKHYPRDTDLVIAWATHAEVPDFVRRTAAGFGGPRWVYPARNSRGQRVQMTTEAGITLSTDYWYDGFAHNFFDNTRATVGELILHEVGHALGLGHVPAIDQIMNGKTYYRYPDGYWKGLYNYGDLRGLSKVGLDQGCLRALRGRAVEVPIETPPID